MLWNVHEADIGDCFELVEVSKSKDGRVQTDEAGKMLTVKKQRPKLLSDLPPELRKCIEDVIVDRSGNFVPRLYSRTAASKGLCRCSISARRSLVSTTMLHGCPMPNSFNS